ncbi:hypothetical protein G7007_04245 [Pseudomonas entomophila]|nr:hypothetical protein [Pseudomonas entomophila]
MQPINPLTVIAIFAGVIEASALASLPFLSERSQIVYTWFLVGFPFFLTLLFFLTLNFNYRSLYVPAEPAKPDAPARTRTPNDDSSASADTQTLVISGPQAKHAIEQHVVRVVTTTPAVHCKWIIYDMEHHACVRLAVEPLSTRQAIPGPMT